MDHIDWDALRKRAEIEGREVEEMAIPAVKAAWRSWKEGHVTVEDARKAAQAAVDTVKVFLPALDNLSDRAINSIGHAYHTAALCWESALLFVPIMGDREQAVLDAWDDARSTMGIALESLQVASEVTMKACESGKHVK